MRNNNTRKKYIAINIVTLIVATILIFIYFIQKELQAPLQLNLFAQKVALVSLVILLTLSALANLGIYLFDKYLH